LRTYSVHYQELIFNKCTRVLMRKLGGGRGSRTGSLGRERRASGKTVWRQRGPYESRRLWRLYRKITRYSADWQLRPFAPR